LAQAKLKAPATTALRKRKPKMNARNVSQPRVLLVDDDRSVLDALGAVLESEGFEVLRAADGREAVEKFRDHRVDLMLLDLNMPVKGGWDTFERLTSIDPLLPVIVITARPDAYPIALARGVAALMQKPLDIRLLLEAIRYLLAEPAERRLSRSISHEPQTHYLA
jgi:DNA-binding response OmpR family regulator